MAKYRKKREALDFTNRTVSRSDLRRRNERGEQVFLAIEEVARLLDLSKGQVLGWTRDGSVAFFELEGRIYFHRDELPGAGAGEGPTEEP